MNKAEHDNIISDYQNRIMGLEENVRMFKNENSALAANLRFLDTEIEEKTEKLTQLQAALKNHEQTINRANILFEEHKSAWEKERRDH
jgi:predicted RNase H-like nuclease (RuvC/YqgF family)